MIPIANIYYLLSYAWDYWAQADVSDIGHLEGTDTTNLLAAMIDAGTRHALRRGLHRDYQKISREMSGIRGRVLIEESKQRLLFEHGRAACVFGELTHASVPNRILRSTLEMLHSAEQIDGTLREQLGHTLRELGRIPTIDLSPGLFRRVKINRNNAAYTFLLALCELAFDCLLPSPDGNTHQFRSFAEDDVRMHDLFESFVRNFLKAHADTRGWDCLGSTQIGWYAVPRDKRSEELLPRMTTDVMLRRDSEVLVIDCKYYGDALRGRFTPKLDSGNLYQIWTYVSQHRKSTTRSVSGLLLYPTVAEDFEVEYQVDGNRIQAATLNLGISWKDIRERLISLVAR